jgi:hypothetical protein
VPLAESDRKSEHTARRIAYAAFAVLAAVSGLQVFFGRRIAKLPAELWEAAVFGSAIWLGWAVAAPAIFGLGRRFDFSPGRRASSALVHLLVATLFNGIIGLGVLLVSAALWPTSPPLVLQPSMLREVILGTRLGTSVLIYVAILGLARSMRLLAELREREVQAVRLEAQATRARLETLAARLQPHFLFNTLHAVGALVDEDPVRARAMLAALGDLLRDVLREADTAEIPLREELRLLQRFLDIEQIRFADRLSVERDIAPETLDVPVPRFVLQPLVENAIRHGLSRRSAFGRLRISAARADGRLRLVVWNDGAPLPPEVREGFGLGATRERLTTRFGSAASFQLGPAPEGGVEAVIELPAA